MCRILPVESSASFDSWREEVGQGNTSQTLLKNGNVQEREVTKVDCRLIPMSEQELTTANDKMNK